MSAMSDTEYQELVETLADKVRREKKRGTAHETAVAYVLTNKTFIMGKKLELSREQDFNLQGKVEKCLRRGRIVLKKSDAKPTKAIGRIGGARELKMTYDPKTLQLPLRDRE